MRGAIREDGGILQRFAKLAARDPEAPFLSISGRESSRSGFLEEVARVAGALRRRGIAEGDVVVLCMPNRIEWCTLFWGCVAVGARPAPLDPATGVWEMAQLLPLLSPKLAFATTWFRNGDPSERLAGAVGGLQVVALDGSGDDEPALEAFLHGADPIDVVERTPAVDEVLYYACTSGTTGNPKILAVSHLGFAQGQDDMGTHLGFGPGERVLLGMPLFHQGGFGMGLQSLLSGGLAIHAEGFDPSSILERVEEQRVTVVQLSPTLGKLLLSVPEIDRRDLGAWRIAYFAGEVLPEDLAARFRKDRGLRVVNVVGSSETGTMLAWDSLKDSDVPPSDLSTLPFTAARILDETGREVPDGEPGILWVRTDGLLLRYEGNPALTAAALREGWYGTGDLAMRLPDGRYRFLGRAKRIIKRGPNLVHPEEVEAFLLGHPSIAAVAVGKEPNDVFGESIVAWIQPVDGAALARADVIGFCRHQISPYKIPDRMHFVRSIPTDVGKVQHRRLEETETLP